jgi:hypothetical protein
LASRHQKGERRSSEPKRWSLIIILIIVTLLVILILIAGGIGGVEGSLHGCYVDGGERGKGVLIKRWVRKRKLIKVINAHLLILTALVAQKHILALMGASTPGEHALDHPQDTARGGGGGGRRRSSCVRASGARSRITGGNIHRDDWSCWVLRLEIGYLMVLQEVLLCHLLDHHHNLWGIPTAVKSGP